MEKLGFIGTGGMGGHMAANLLNAGFPLVVYDVSREATKKLEDNGAVYATSPRALAEASEVVLSMLPIGDAVREIGTGKDGLIDASSAPRTWIDFSSVEQQAIITAEQRLREKGWTVIDATVGGVEEYAKTGDLPIMIAGDKATVDRIRPILEPMGKKVTYCGALGNAKLVKTATAMQAAVQIMGTVEVFNWLKSRGISEEITREVFRDSQGWSVFMEDWCKAIVSKEFKARKSWMPKDIGFGLDNAQEKGVPLPFTALARQMFNIARSNGVDGYSAVAIAWKVYELLGKGE